MDQATAAAAPRQWILVQTQTPEAIIARTRPVSMHPEVHAAYARHVNAKAEAEGLLYKDIASEYYARFKSDPNAAAPEARSGRNR